MKMAAPMRMTFTKLRFFKKNLFQLNFAPCRGAYSTLSEESKELEVDIEEEINKLRDVSNMAPRYKCRMTVRTFDMEKLKSSGQFSRSYLRKMYSIYGKASGKSSHNLYYFTGNPLATTPFVISPYVSL